MTEFAPTTERRCSGCGARARGRSCGECGTSLAPRSEIGVLNGVNNNYGTVQNVYNIAPAAPEVVDLRDIQDSLNERFPERVPFPRPPSVPQFPAKDLPKQLGASPFVKKVNITFYVLTGVVALLFLAFMAAIVWM